jgi:hypothetical protein
MNKKTNLLLASALFLAMQPLQGLAAVGQVEFSTVGVIAMNQSGTTRALNKGSEIDIGDTIQTNDARAQLKFTDGGYISLQPNTAFKVEDYAYTSKKDGTDKSFFSLIKGGMRAITGLVGKSNKQAYRLNTPVATIGIRGTEFVAEYDTKLLVKVGEGAVYMANNGGDITLYAGQIGEVNDSNDKPALTDEEPSVGAKGPEGGKSGDVQEQAEKESEQQNQFSESEQTNEQGEVTIITNDTDKTYSGTVAWADYCDGACTHIDDTNKLKFKANGDFIGFEKDVHVVDFTGSTVDKGHVGSGDDQLSWMRLTGGSFNETVDGSLVTESNSNTHVIFGQATSPSQMENLTSSHVSATYNLAGGTQTTNENGALGSISYGTLSVDFYYASVDLLMELTNGGHDYSVSASGSMNNLNGSAVSETNCDGEGCNFYGIGFFVGADAGKAALAYKITGTESGGAITGVAGFVKGSSSITNN